MSMLRRPLTQLTLCEEDIRWMGEEMAKKEKQITEQSKGEEGVDEVESMDVSTSEKPLEKTSTPNIDTRPLSKLRQQLEAAPTPITSTPIGIPAVDMTTPINSEPILPPAPNVRLTRAQARQRALSVGGMMVPNRNAASPPVDLRFETLPETPEVESATRPSSSSSSSISTSSSESPNAHLFATPQSSAQHPPSGSDSSGGGPSSNTRRSQR